MALGKLGDFLNKDLGALVKDAGKVLNTDVGSIAKGAGKVLNADVGDIAKGTKTLLTMDLGDLLKGVNEKDGGISVGDPATAAPAAAPTAAPVDAGASSPPSAPSASPPPAPPRPAPSAPAASSTGPATTPPQSTAPPVAKPATKPGDQVKFTPELVVRSRRAPPSGTDLRVLLPWTVGAFERSHSTPSGDLASDPVAAIYSSAGERVQVVLNMCWDADEALQQVAELKAQMGDKARATADPSWVIGMTEQGVALIWTRDCYCFTATSARGAAPLARFLAAFPY